MATSAGRSAQAGGAVKAGGMARGAVKAGGKARGAQAGRRFAGAASAPGVLGPRGAWPAVGSPVRIACEGYGAVRDY